MRTVEHEAHTGGTLIFKESSQGRAMIVARSEEAYAAEYELFFDSDSLGEIIDDLVNLKKTLDREDK